MMCNLLTKEEGCVAYILSNGYYIWMQIVQDFIGQNEVHQTISVNILIAIAAAGQTSTI